MQHRVCVRQNYTAGRREMLVSEVPQGSFSGEQPATHTAHVRMDRARSARIYGEHALSDQKSSACRHLNTGKSYRCCHRHF